MTVSPNEKVNFCTYIMKTNKKKTKHQKLKIKYHFGKYFVGLVFQSHKEIHINCINFT